MVDHPIPNPLMLLPFGALLLMIALGPLLFPKWWHHHYPKAALALASVTILYYIFPLNAGGRVLEVAHEYFSFIALVGSLFIIAGGIHITVKGEATPGENIVFLFFGAVIANFIGTTGASMLLIRPWIRMNKYRITAHHIVFFIFIVSNVGGCLTPIGDPPLFIGYIKGIPFWWVAQHCWPMWCVAVGGLLAIFLAVDYRNYLRAPKAVRAHIAEPPDVWKFQGGLNLLFLLIVLGAVFIEKPIFLREFIMLGAALASFNFTRISIYAANQFTFEPVKEVALLFIGIFATMLPALDLLAANAKNLAAASPGFYYWATGALSAFLDNAPTYYAFLTAANAVPATPQILADPSTVRHIVAISVGAVFFGAMTYIGNGPNFMVKSIADQNKVHSPGFISYILKFALPILLPICALIWFLFFS